MYAGRPNRQFDPRFGISTMEPLGTRIRQQRRRLGLTQDELAGRAGISKPYLSLIETGRITNPPSDEKLNRLEQSLGFTPGDLLGQAHLQRTPRDVRAVLQKLLDRDAPTDPESDAPLPHTKNTADPTSNDPGLSSVLRELLTDSSHPAESFAGGAVPVINRVAAGYPTDFDDLTYPARVACEFVACPGLADKHAFAARVHGDGMTPKYRPGDIVIFSPAAAARDGDDCFVRFDDGQTAFKRVFFETDPVANASVVRLQPRNERHRAQLTPAHRVTGIYKAVYRFSRVDDE
jgi:repressor LexA